MKRISFVIPSYNEAESLSQLLSSISDLAQQHNWEYDITIVDDGSTDTTPQLMESLRSQHSTLHYIQFRKNSGKAYALQTGFARSTGDFIVMMDADLQDDPKDVPRLLDVLEKGYDAVTGWKKTRNDPWHKVIPSRVINAIVRSMYGVQLHDMNCGLKAFKKEVVEEMDLYGELYRYMLIFAHNRGFKITELETTHHERRFGKSKFGVTRILKGFFDLFTVYFLTKYGKRPLHFFGTVGSSITFVGFISLLYLLIIWLTGQQIGNRPLLLFGILCVLIGVQLIMTGFIAELIISRDAKINPPIKKEW